MVAIIRGIVKDGKIIPENPLPEGRTVAISLLEEDNNLPEDMQRDLEAWSRGGVDALLAFEKMLEEEDTHAAR